MSLAVVKTEMSIVQVDRKTVTSPHSLNCTMPNVWTHQRPNAESTCIAPDIAPYGRWNTDEIIWASVPSFFLITAWRMIFIHVLGPYLGGYVARKETPNPHPKPDFVDKDAGTQRLSKLSTYHKRITLKKSKIPKTKKKEESAQQKSDHQLATNIKRRNEGKKKQRKRLVLPKGLKQHQSPSNLAFLASLDSDETRSEIPVIMKELGYSLSEIREYFDWRRDATTMKGMQQKFNEEAWKGLTMTFMTIYGIWVMSNEPFFSDPSLLAKEWYLYSLCHLTDSLHVF